VLRKILPFVVLLFATSAFAQSVQQSGTVTNKHIPYWVTSGVIADGGSATDSPISTMGVTNNGGAGFCVSSDRQSAAGRNQLCFGASTAAAATITLQNYGTAAAQALNFVINGVMQSFIAGTGTFTAGHIPCFLNSTGTIQDCGLAASAGTITTGVWNGTAVAVGFGGTGGTTQATARTGLGLGTMSTQNANAVAITGGTVTGLPTPTVAADAAIKSYVDSVATGLNILAPSRLATAAVLPNSPTYSNGASGVGATLTAGSATTLTVDGTLVNASDVVLVKNQAAPAQNGIYTLTTAGGGVAWVLTRATYFDQAAEMKVGSYTFITAGAANTNASFTLQSTVTTVGTDAVTFVQFSSTGSGVTSLGGSTGTITLGGGLAISANALNTAGGIDSNVINSVGGNYTVLTTDAGKTINVSGGPFTVTLPGVGGFGTTDAVSVCNANANSITQHAVLLSGFPNPILSRLYMNQCVTVAIENGVWEAKIVPGRFRPAFIPTLFVDTGGSDTNDGLVSNAPGNALRNSNTCPVVLGQEYDLLFFQPICSLTTGQVFGPVAITGQFVNSSVMYFNGNGGNSTVKATAATGTSALFLADFAPYVISVNMTWDCTGGLSTGAGCTALSLHQQGGMDLNSGTVLSGNSAVHVGLSCDSMCKVNGGATITLSGTLLNGMVGNLGSMFNLGGGITLANSTAISSDIVLLTGGSQMNFSGGLTAGSGISVSEIFGVRGNGSQACLSNLTVSGSFGAARQWGVLNNGQLINTSAQVVPGSTSGINTLATWGNGIVVNSGASAGGC